MISKDIQQEVKDIFTKYLIEKIAKEKPQKGMRFYQKFMKVKGHFDIETMYIQMKNKNYRVSRATLYNTIVLLLDCKLIRKHQFGKNPAQYEKSFHSRQHDHVICTSCNEVIEFCDPRILNIKNSIIEHMKINIDSHSLNFYSDCLKPNNCNKNI